VRAVRGAWNKEEKNSAGYDGDMGTLLPIATGRPWCMW
jgi:hypothetical protein